VLNVASNYTGQTNVNGGVVNIQNAGGLGLPVAAL